MLIRIPVFNPKGDIVGDVEISEDQVKLRAEVTPNSPGQLAAMDAEIRQLKEKVDAGKRFKTFVHHRLDQAGINKEPNGPHSAEGCRVGDRLDIIQNQRDHARNAVRDLIELLEQVDQYEVNFENKCTTAIAAARLIIGDK